MANQLIRADSHDEFSIKVLWNDSVLENDTFYQQLKTEMASSWIGQR